MMAEPAQDLVARGETIVIASGTGEEELIY